MIAGETPAATVVREVQEETGVQVEIIELLGWYERTGFRAHLSPVYVCRPQRGSPQAQDIDTVQVRYFPLHRLPRGLCPWYQSILQRDLPSPQPRPLRQTQHLGLWTVVHCLGLDLLGRLGLLS
jgi:ADP-ribose pyrophosphatase YjhB (NUDIX family)